jgi:hypothetical protein
MLFSAQSLLCSEKRALGEPMSVEIEARSGRRSLSRNGQHATLFLSPRALCERPLCPGNRTVQSGVGAISIDMKQKRLRTFRSSALLRCQLDQRLVFVGRFPQRSHCFPAWRYPLRGLASLLVVDRHSQKNQIDVDPPAGKLSGLVEGTAMLQCETTQQSTRPHETVWLLHGRSGRWHIAQKAVCSRFVL